MNLKDNEQLGKYLASFENQSRALKKELKKLCWYMRGSISHDESFRLTPEDRKLITELINENLEITKTTKLPFF